MYLAAVADLTPFRPRLERANSLFSLLLINCCYPDKKLNGST